MPPFLALFHGVTEFLHLLHGVTGFKILFPHIKFFENKLNDIIILGTLCTLYENY